MTAIDRAGARRAPRSTRAPRTARARVALRSASDACIHPRTFERRRQTPGKAIEPLHLEGIRDRLAKQVALQDPRDIVRTPSQMRLEWHPEINRATLGILGGPPRWMAEDRMLAEGGAFADVDGLDPTERLVFTRHGLRRYLAEVYGGHARPLLDRLVKATDDRKAGATVANMAGALLSHGLDKQPLQLRTVRTRDPVSGGIVRAVRGVFRSYTAFDDLDYVQALLDSSATRDLPVLAYRRGDDGMRLKFALDPIDRVDLNTPITTIDAWNSESGGGRPASTVLQGGVWKLICTNGMATTERGAVFRWVHSGNRRRVADGVPQAVAEIRTKADGLVERYRAAVEVQIDDAWRWLQGALDGLGASVNDETSEAIERAISHETATPGRMLASTVDAVSWVAHEQADQFRQRELEELSVRIMARGLDEASRSPDGRLHAPRAA